MRGGRKVAVAALLVALAAGLYLFVLPRSASSSPRPMDDAPLALPVKDPRAVIRKRARELWLFDGAALRKRYRVVLGRGEGDKEREGDRRTPEGMFYVCTRNDQSRFHKFLGLSYPGPSDAARGLKAGMITRAEHEAILAAHRERRCPPWKTALGGEVGIHGGGVGRDWTLGCIALENRDVDELWQALPLGTPVLIEP
jgi:murein L,D-transpeptidase YafK